MDRSCIMFNCLWQLWDWLDPPVLTSSASMEGKKMAPPPQQVGRPHHPQAHQPIQGDPQLQPLYPATAQHHYIQQQQHHSNSNAVVHQPPRPPHPQNMGARSPLLENHQDLYGTRQPTELARQYAIREQQLANQRMEQQQQRSIPMGNSSYSIQSPSQDPILSAPVPPGYNASVHQAYLRRNQHQLDHQQIYQNHQSLYQPPAEQPRLYQPYTSRIQPQQSNYAPGGHSHTQLLRQQYNELQQMKLQQQMQYQSQAQIQQQQTFAQRQILHQHLHSRQQSQQNIAQYGTSPNSHTAQLNEVNARLSKRQDVNLSPTDDYGTHPLKANSSNNIQTQNNPQSPISKSSGEPVSSPSTKSPSGSDSRRSSSGTSQALRSPIAQRPLSAPVTKAGWLYKQGSDGLKVWRKRWFVLSEYCLFYYKGQEEDKLLGSVLLPSYQVSLCTGDEKNLRKYSFKCEHANMRTYILAAPDQASMEQWVRVLTMAATMQDGSSPSKSQNQTNPTYQQSNYEKHQNKLPVNSGDQENTNTEGNVIVQHMYENAPPKPRRSNEGYQSPNLDRSERYDPNYDILREPTYGSSENAQQKGLRNRMNGKSPTHNNPSGVEAIYESKSNNSNYAQQRHLAKSPEAIYNTHNLSLPLTNTHSNRLENNKSPLTLTNSLPNRVSHNDNRTIHNKSPGYFENKNLSQDNLPKQNFQMDNQNIYGESGYQKMLQQQEMNKRMLEREQKYGKEQGTVNPGYQQQTINRANGTERQSFERRTPDTYGRSVIVPGYYNKGRSSDYEDVYAANKNSQTYGETSYTRPMSPVAYGDDINSMQATSHQRYLQSNVDQNQIYQQAPSVQLRQKKIPHNYTAPGMPHNTVPRPHSADFLEYESKNPPQNINNVYARNANQSVRQQPPRPKSSLDINSYDYNGDSYYYSEARYAEKMRQSAHYLRSKNAASGILTPRSTDPRSPEFTSERKLSMPSFGSNEGTYDSDIRESIYGVQDQNRNISGTDKYSEITGPNSNWTLKNKSLSQIMSQDDVYNRSNSAMSEGSTVSGFNRDSSQMGSGSGDQFMRSASARLPSVGSDQVLYRDGEKKVQQREESMKRLLEWKQRMLQSPLTRKPTPATLSLVRSLPPGPSQRQTLPKASTRVNQIQSSYNSYSSDDEERLGDDIGAADNVESQPGQGQAGRSPNTSTQTPNSPPSLTIQPMGNSQLPKIKPTMGQQSNVHVPDLNTTNAIINKTQENNIIDNEQSVDSTDIGHDDDTETESDAQLEYTDNDLDEILAQSDNDDSKNDSASGRKSVMNFHGQINDTSISSLKDNNSNSQRFHDYEICEIQQETNTKKKNEEECPDLPERNKCISPVHETPPNGEISEDHYLPMSPRKAVLSPEPAHTEIIKNINVFGSIQSHEDNPYVEMSQGIGVESAFQNEEMQAYEVVCVGSATIEPVYQELANLPDKNVLEEKNSSDGNDNTNSNDGAIVPPPKSILRKQISESKLVVKSSSRNDVKSPLPDILMNSQSKSSIVSSDADDEVSKEFLMDRAFSRFSLSDNFRPASYYLNSSGVPADIQDSSDSELVSPPPIPTSPPPMEELEASYTPMTLKLAVVSSSSTVKTNIERKSMLMDHGNTPSMYDTIFKGERIKRNRASLPTDTDKKLKDFKQSLGPKRASLDTKVVPPTYKTCGNTDSDSLLSYNADRGSSRMSLESDFSSKLDMSISSSTFNIDDRQSNNLPSDKTSINDESEFIELRHAHNNSEIERMMKRRPLSEESFMEIESLDSNYNENMDDVNLDQYLDELQASNVYLYTNNMYPTLKPSTSGHNTRQLDMAAVGYLNERVAAIREEVQYENLHLMEGAVERSRSRNSVMSNANSDPDTVNTFQTVRPLSRMSNLSGLSGSSQVQHKSTSNLSVRSASRSSLPIESNINTSTQSRLPYNHTRHSSIEQPTISYYSKTTPYFENEASILKNLNPSLSQDQITNKVNISDMTKKSPKTLINSEPQPIQETSPRVVKPSHSRESSLEQSAPYYYSDISSQDNLNVSSSSTSYSPLFSKNNMNFQSKLNNQRRKGPLGKKCDISHIHNPIHSNLSYQQVADPDEGPIQLAAVARCVSVEFLSATDKYSDIDDKNIYESHTTKTEKVRESMPSTTSKNIYLSNHDKTTTGEGAMSLFAQGYNDCPDERKRSIERILHNVVKSGGEVRSTELSRSRSQSALMDIDNIRSPTMITNILTETYTQQISMNTIKPVNSNLYVETGTFSSNDQRNSDSSETYARITDDYNFNGEMMWEEDTIWSENLRRVSQRHARSLDRLDCLVSPSGASGRRSVDLKTMLRSSMDSEGETREATYVNGNVRSQRSVISSKRRSYNKKFSRKPPQPLQPVDQSNENDVYVQLAADVLPDANIIENDDGVYEQLTTESLKSTNNDEVDPLDIERQDGEVRRRYEIDRENIRQWDLMSSGLMKGGGGRDGDGEGEGSCNSNTNSTTASMSASLTGAENLVTKRQPLVNSSGSGRSNTIPIRAVSPRVRQPAEQNSWQMTDTDSQWTSQNLTQNRSDDIWNTARSPSRQSANQPIRAVSPRVRRSSEVDDRPPPPPVPPPPDTPPPTQNLSVSLPDLSAGELLGRTHEELVLLLIQLRRRHAATAGAIEQCCTQIHNLQSHINSDEVPDKHQENLQRLEALRSHLADLERHYTKSKPLVHLVDNMVKLGSLYNKGPTTMDRLEYNQMLRERALLQEAQEQRRWAECNEGLSRDQAEQRVEQLRAMERSVAGEAQELRGLRQEREALHRALGGAHLQHDLSRVHAMLAINSKKLEQTVAGNARLEQELAVLRQKLQQGQHYSSKQDLDDGGDETNAKTAADATALLEDELKRVQQLVSDLQKQRQELSIAVRQLTDKSQTLGLVGQNGSVQSSNEFLNDTSSQAYKKRCSPPWVETDLDGEVQEHGSTSPVNTKPSSLYSMDMSYSEHRAPSPDHSDDQGLSSAFANLSNVEKQEIKTVRIVKRESERRQRDRERSLQPGNPEWSSHQAASTLDQLLEEESLGQYSSSRETSLPRSYQTSQSQYHSYNTNSYQTDNTSTRYSYQKDNTSTNYQPRSHNINPPNTLSLTNVNNPFDNYSTSNTSLNNKYVSSPSLTNNNDYSNNYQDTLSMTTGKYSSYQSNATILPLPVSSSYSSTLLKHNLSQSVPYLDGSTTDVRSTTTYSNGILSPALSKTASITSLTKTNAELSPVFTSEAARQIIFEMAGEKNGVVKSNGSQHRRQVPKEKRRHNTAPHHLSAKDLDQTNGDDFFYQEKWYRARDDVDMERVLRGSSRSTPRGPPPLAAPPDVVRSTLSAPHTEHYTEHTIDRLLAAPNKIVIPERYIPEQAPELSPEEQQRRQEKVESIKKMLSSTTPSGDPSKSPDDNDKRQREHLLQLNQILAKQVMEMSKIVAVKASQSQPAENEYDSEDRSPDVELPIYQQRDNFFT